MYEKVQLFNQMDIDPYIIGLLISMAQKSCEYITGDIIEVGMGFSLARFSEC
jgi:hypothetical protein